jgi:hypothetical protein
MCLTLLALDTHPDYALVLAFTFDNVPTLEKKVSTRDFPENRDARCGDRVRIVMLDVEDARPVEDILWTDEGCREVFERAGLRPVRSYRPLGKSGEGPAWVNETAIAPWVIHVLALPAT